MISGPLPRLNAPTLQPDRPILALANSRFVPPRPFFPSHPLPQPRFVCPSSRKGNEEYYRLVIGGATFRYPPRNRCDFSLLPSIDVSEREAPSLSLSLSRNSSRYLLPRLGFFLEDPEDLDTRL